MTTGELMDLLLCRLAGTEIFREVRAIAERSVADCKEHKESLATAVSISHGGVADVLQMGSNVEGIDQVVFSAVGSMAMAAARDNSNRVADVGDEALHKSDRIDLVMTVVLSTGGPETVDGVLQSGIDYASFCRRSLQEVTHGRAPVWGVANSGNLLFIQGARSVREVSPKVGGRKSAHQDPLSHATSDPLRVENQ
ncbi:hypothetical protein NE237_023790 [Protea cynaroides]|uniref:Uncharacterized protein n=1 Tax=Protea cynaroides TaxID=273540 RepID=A0A9Q0HEN3_9MAGN|nr:hypothetical protein NE237_023790 [Protea cynaroides]